MCEADCVVGSVETEGERSDLASMPLDRLEREITELASHISAAMCRWLCLVAEFDRREGCASWGFRSCAEWLALRCSLSPHTAREQVRVARRLAELPLVREHFARGELSYSKVRAISRVASPESEDELVSLARHATAAQLEQLVRGHRGALAAEGDEANRAYEERYLAWSWEDDGSMVIRGHLSAEDGTVLLNALQAARDQLRQDEWERASKPEDVPAETPADPSQVDQNVPAETLGAATCTGPTADA